jgi:hypothetical protein
MNRIYSHLPLLITVLVVIVLLIHGPIAQLPHYHEFADQRTLFGVPSGADVLSNIGFALVGLWGMLSLWRYRDDPSLGKGWPGYFLFMLSLVFTAIGSGFYHLEPDNARLVWDRLPIALACGGLLAGVRSEMDIGADGRRQVALFSIFAVLSVVWWRVTDQAGHGDLRPYLLLQGLPLLLIPLWHAIYGAPPLWHAIYGAPRKDRIAFGAAILLYVLAKAAELHDRELLEMFGWISGHSIKHLLATVAAAVLIGRLNARVLQDKDAGAKKVAVA